VDDFKRFNDTWGHAAGDAVLRELGGLLLGHVRGEDIPCRYGGDEFIIVLPDASREMTRERADRLCEHTRHLHIQFEGRTLDVVTLARGIAVFPEDGATSDAILRASDNALYRAKHKDSGRVVMGTRASDSPDFSRGSIDKHNPKQ
jgi:diguanylate cyclase (GGDEF)-like protein